MAATSFKALILVFYFLAICWEIPSTWDPIDCHHHRPCQEALRVFPGAYFSHYGRFSVTGRASIASVVKRFGFHRAKVPLVSWTKHGCTSLLIPGHDPPLNITIFGDISINPGPEALLQNSLKRRNGNLPNILDLHTNSRVITYTRVALFGTRRASRSFVCGSVLHDLKLNGLLSFKGCRAGRRKISVRISDRIRHTTRRDRTTSRTSVLVPIVNKQRLRVGSFLKFCSLNARSVRNKSADFVSYVQSSGADIFAVTETWLSEIDVACRAEITPPGYKLFDHTRSD